jgi:hypothetical protein
VRRLLPLLCLPPLLGGCFALPLVGVPAHALRNSPPPTIDDRAVAIGAPAPRFALPTSAGVAWSLTDALARGPVVLLFYRGHW